jgi:ABC-type sugar transport system permease subunit
MRITKKQSSLYVKKQRKGYLFMIPFLTGFLLFYLTPFIRSLVFSFATLKNSGEGIVVHFVGFENYTNSLSVDPTFIVSITDSLIALVISVPSIILFSFFTASILNQKFRGRTVARAIMFLPVVLTSGVVALMQNDVFIQNATGVIAGASSSGQNPSNMINLTSGILNLLPFQSSGLFDFVTVCISQVYNITISSGVQILIFLAGLQNISPSIFESSSIEGATGWQSFWKITFPMISPLILVNIVYTLVDQMCGFNNKVTQAIYNMTFGNVEFGRAAAMSWIYLLLVIVIMGVIVSVVNKLVFYEN